MMFRGDVIGQCVADARDARRTGGEGIAQAKKLEAMLQKQEGVESYVAYVGTGSPRFYLPLDQQLPATNFAQFVVLADDTRAREELRNWLLKDVVPQFPELQMRVTRLENGPPVGYPVQFRVSGEDLGALRATAAQVAEVMRANANVRGVNFDWSEFADTGGQWLKLEIPYPKTGGPGGGFIIIGMVTPISPQLCGVFFWRVRKVAPGWQRDTWRFLYRDRLEARHWHVLEQDRVLLEDLAPNANDPKHEHLYDHDMGVVRLRRVMRSLAQEQIEAEKATA